MAVEATFGIYVRAMRVQDDDPPRLTLAALIDVARLLAANGELPPIGP